MSQDVPVPSVSSLSERGALVDRYVVLSRLGAGAMGVVLEAYDPELDRKVALKLIKPRGRGSTAARARLQREAQALAKLDHRNVIAVHDVGEHIGQLFIAMELVKGQTLGEWMESAELRRASWREIVHVFSEAGHGLAAAHDVGLVHRDFKPDNVMIDTDLRVRVMDFGLARVGNEERDKGELSKSFGDMEDIGSGQSIIGTLTRTGAILGTPSYMSPEQFEGRPPDGASDQFSFCVSLYEALYGERPFKGQNIVELFNAVSQGSVTSPRPSTVPTWVRRVVMKGLAPNPHDRFRSMSALLESLAADPARRRRKWSAVAGLGVILIGGVWGIVWGTQQSRPTCDEMDERLIGIWDDDRRAEVQKAIVSTGLPYASETWYSVERVLNDYTRRWVAERTRACEATRRGEQSETLLDLRMACLNDRLSYVNATVKLLAQADDATVEGAVDVVSNIPSIDHCDNTDALAEAEPPPEDPYMAKKVDALKEELAQASVLYTAGKYAEGLAMTRVIIAKSKKLNYQPLYIRALLRHGMLQTGAAEYEDARTTFIKTYDLSIKKRMIDEAADASTWLMFVTGVNLDRHDDGRRWMIHAAPLSEATGRPDAWSRYLNYAGMLAQQEGQYEESQRYHEEALALDIDTLGSAHPALVYSLYNLGEAEMAQGQYSQARAHLTQAMDASRTTHGAEHPLTVSILQSLGNLEYWDGNLIEAKNHFTESLRISERVSEPGNPGTAYALHNLGNVEASLGDYDEAKRHLHRALKIMENKYGPQHLNVAMILGSLAGREFEIGEYEAAGEHFNQALSIRELELGYDHPDVAIDLSNLGTLAVTRGRYDAARAYHERAIEIWEVAHGPKHPRVAEALGNLGALELSQGEHTAARAYLEQALTILDASHPSAVFILLNLGKLELEEGEYEAAVLQYTHALTVTEETRGPDHTYAAEALSGLGRVQLAQFQIAEAIGHLERALAIQLAAESENDALLGEIRFALARALWDAPSDRSKNRVRTLVESARVDFARHGDSSSDELGEVETWILNHDIDKVPQGE